MNGCSWPSNARQRRNDRRYCFSPVTRSNPRQAYLGYTLARSAWGQGYASEAARKLLDYLFRVLDLHRVIADCDVDNAASIRLLERLGFRREAHYLESFWFESEAAGAANTCMPCSSGNGFCDENHLY